MDRYNQCNIFINKSNIHQRDLFQILIHRGIIHRDIGVQRTMLEKMGRSFVNSIQEPLEGTMR